MPVYHGNSIDNALYGGSFTHSLAYVVIGDGYLQGMGTGSSYIAELYYDLKYPGVLVGSAFLGAGIFMSETHRPGHVLRNAARLLIMPVLFITPRGSATEFITTLISPSTLVAVVGTSILASLWGSRPTASRANHRFTVGSANRQPVLPTDPP
jgi:hypothetical protein